jgi:hypothetical protein
VAEGTVADIWGLDMYGTNGGLQQRAWVMDTNATMAVIFTKLKDFGQSLRNTSLVNITRSLPASSNATCNSVAVVPLSNAVYTYTSYNMYGNLTLLLDQSIYCDAPPRGAKRQIQMEFTYNFYFDFPAEGRRRRRTTEARQALEARFLSKALVFDLELYRTTDDMSPIAPQQSAATTNHYDVLTAMAISVLVAVALVQ